METSVAAYLEAESSAHRFDVRSKIIMLAVFSVGIFFVRTWIGIAIYAAMFAVALIASHVSPAKVLKVSIPIYIICAFTVLFNMFPYSDGAVSFQLWGLQRGLFFAARILVLVWASLILCFNATSNELTDAFASLLSPLAAIRVPVDDIATVLSIALRFIPLTVGEFYEIRNAQWSRGAAFDDGGLIAQLKANCTVLVPLFVSMFRRADRLANAMDARCYGMPGVRRSHIRNQRMGASSMALALATVAACIAAAILF